MVAVIVRYNFNGCTNKSRQFKGGRAFTRFFWDANQAPIICIIVVDRNCGKSRTQPI